MSLPVPNVVIHHTEMGECYTVQDCIIVMRSIQDFHMDGNGWSDIGYSFLIGGDGTVFQGRGWDRVGAHAPGYNDKSIGISLIGNFMVELPPDVEMEAAKSMIECGIELGYISPEYLLYGHRDVTDTDCPGDVLYDEISTWPDKVTLRPSL
jgi:N-acetylmuramoyl-L-alanine amidase